MYSKIWIILLGLSLVLASFAGCGGGKKADMASGTEVVKPEVALNQTWNLAIFPFDTVGDTKLSGEEVMNLLITELLDLEGYKIIDRQSLQQVLNQLGFGLSDLADPANRTKVGSVLGAQLFCFGSVNKKFDLVTARVNFTETGEMLLAVKSSKKGDLKNIEAVAGQLRQQLISAKVAAFLNQSGEVSGGDKVPPSEVLEVKGYGAIVDDDLATARELALKDAYARAIEQGCGVKLMRKTQVENYQLVRDKILTESVGYVTSYDIVNENPESDYGYEVTVKASVSKEPISDLDKLQLMVKYLLAEPRIAVLIGGELKGEELTKGRSGVIAGQIGLSLQKAGFSVVDAQTIEEKKEELAGSSSPEDAARLGKMLDANVTVRGNISADITGRVEEIDGKKLDFPILSATTTGVLRIILAETAEVLSAFSHGDLPSRSNVGSGTTEDAAIGESLDNFIDAASKKLAWEMASELGEPIKMRLELRGVTQPQAEQFLKQIEGMPKHIVVEASMQHFEKDIADYQIKTAVKSLVLQQSLSKMIDPSSFEAKELVPEKIEFGTITMSLKR